MAAIATGNPATTQAAEEVLRAGGNAVDAAIAASVAAFVSEPLLASAGGSGIMTTALAGQPPLVIDFFSSMPGQNAPERDQPRDFGAVEIDFGSAIQAFHVGRASAAAPLAFAGLAEASRRLGRMPLSVVVEPAIALAKIGAVVTPESADVFRLLWPINVRDPATAGCYSKDQNPPAAGTQQPMPEMAALFEAFAEQQCSPRYFDDAILTHFGTQAGGSITESDLEVQPQLVSPRVTHLGGCEVLASPRLGGRLVSVIAEALRRSCSDSAINPALNSGFDAAFNPAAVETMFKVAAACRAGSLAKGDAPALGCTTHISVIDDQGGAAAVTLTNGEGCGYIVPGTGVQMNNFLGEEDLHPDGFFVHPPGHPLPSMIAPTIARGPDGFTLALGSGGANRIRSVVAQVLWRIIDGASLEAAVMAPRAHAEAHAVWFEAPELVKELTRVQARMAEVFNQVFPFPERAFFFGGVHVAARRHGESMAFADPRRGGQASVF